MNFWIRAHHTWLWPLAAVIALAYAVGPNSGPVMSLVLIFAAAWWAIRSWRHRRKRRTP